MQDNETIEIYNARVEEYAKIAEDIKPGKTLLKFMSLFNAGDRILDLGCGPGASAAHMKAAGLDVDALDASSEMVRLANEQHGVSARLGTFEDLTEVDTYHGIWASFSLLHAPRSEFPRYLKNIHTALKSEGVFYIGMKLGDREERDSIGRMYSYYTEAQLETHLANTGFEIFDRTYGESKGLSGEIAPWISLLTKAR